MSRRNIHQVKHLHIIVVRGFWAGDWGQKGGGGLVEQPNRGVGLRGNGYGFGVWDDGMIQDDVQVKTDSYRAYEIGGNIIPHHPIIPDADLLDPKTAVILAPLDHKPPVSDQSAVISAKQPPKEGLGPAVKLLIPDDALKQSVLAGKVNQLSKRK